jgi:hypothetical protein
MVFRLVCSNGLIRGESRGSERIRWPRDPERFEEAMRAAINACRRDGRALVEGLARAGSEPVDDPAELIRSQARSGHLVGRQRDNVLGAFALEPGGDLYAVVNAFTRAAQQEPTVHGRHQLERVGGILLGV